MSPASHPLQFHRVTRARSLELARFLAKHGKFRYCACMRWRMKSSKFSRSTEEGRSDALEGPVGVLAYLDQELVGWCSVAPRECYAGLAHYRELSRIDENFNTASDAGFRLMKPARSSVNTI